MKKIIIVALLSIAITILGLWIGYGIGYDAGANSSNLDDVYAQYLNDILPDNVNDTSLIVYERHYSDDVNFSDGYYVYHNCNQSEYWKRAKQSDFYWDITFSNFNDMSIWNKRL